MKKKKDENTETTENVKKKKKAPIIIAVVVLIVIIGSCNANSNKDSSTSDSSTSSESSITETTEEATEEPTTTDGSDMINQIESDVLSTEETTTAAIDISPENFVSTVEEAIQGAVGEGEDITNVVLTDGTLTISADLSKADITIVPLEDLAISRASSITDTILEFDKYDDLWNEIIIDFGDLGQVKKSKSDIIESPYGRYFDITEIER